MNRALELKFLSWRIMRRRSQGLLGTTTSSKDLEDPWRMLHVRGLTAHGVRRAQRYEVRVAGTSMPAISIQKARKDALTLIVDPAYQAVRNCFEAPVFVDSAPERSPSKLQEEDPRQRDGPSRT